MRTGPTRVTRGIPSRPSGHRPPKAIAPSTPAPRRPRRTKQRDLAPDRRLEFALQTDLLSAAVHEGAHAIFARMASFEIVAVSVRRGRSNTGQTIVRLPRHRPGASAAVAWQRNPQLDLVVRKLRYVLAGDIAEAMLAGTGRFDAPSADAARATFDALPDAARTALLAAEAAEAGTSDLAHAWAIAVDLCGPGDASAFLDLVTGGVRRSVAEHAAEIMALALELHRGSVLDGPAVAAIAALGEPVEADDGPPTSGSWISIATFVAGGIDVPARVGETYAFDDPRVVHSPGLFLPADASAEVIRRALDDYRIGSMWSESGLTALQPGRRVVRCVAALVARTRDGRPAIRIARGELVCKDSWVVTRWPRHFRPSMR
jgi:hypothetical protein